MRAAFGEGASMTSLVGPDVSVEQLTGRRKVARTLRAVEIALERGMKALSRNPGYEPTQIWRYFHDLYPSVDGRWGGFTLDDAIEYVRSFADEEPMDRRVEALAVFRLLMDRSDLFLGDETGMRESLRFSVRPEGDVECLKRVQGWLEGYEGVDGSEEVLRFRKEVQARVKEAGTTFSETTNAFIDIIRRRIVERRSTQRSPVDPLVPTILRATGLYDASRELDMATAERFMKDIREVGQWDSFSRARIEAAEARDAPPPSPRLAIVNDCATDDEGLLVQDPHASIRREFTHPVYVIDAADAQELDDGISLAPNTDGTYWVHVHIADPTRWIDPGSAVARVAESRGETLYYPEGGRTMISGGVGRMSLGAKAEEGQPTMTFSIKLSEDGTVLDQDVSVGMVRNVHKITYDVVNRILEPLVDKSADRVWTLDLGNDRVEETYSSSDADTPSTTQSTTRDLKTLNQLATHLRRRRLYRQGFDYQIPTASIGIVGLPQGTSPRYEDKALQYRVPVEESQGSASADMVAEFMILAGRVAGKFGADRGLALPFRGTTRPYIPSYALSPGQTAEQVLEAFYDRRERNPRLRDDMFDFAATGIVLQTAPVGVTPLNHWAIGIHAADGGYSRVTSPLRRFSDMLAHWQIKQALVDGRAAFQAEDMSARVQYTDRLASRIRRIGISAEAYWRMTFLQWLHGHPTSSPLALDNLAATVYEEPAGDVILGISDKSAKVYIPELRVTASMEQPVYKALRVGEDVRVKVTGVQVSPNTRLTVAPL
jgi:exoribonuclease R